MKNIFHIFITITIILTQLPSIAFAAVDGNFLDIPEDHAFEKEINFLVHNNIINGVIKNDGAYFEPNRSINRCEFLKILFNIYEIQKDTDTVLPFPDIQSSDWCYPYVVYGYTNNFIQGQDGLFHPYRTINKVEALKIAFNVFEIERGNPITTGFQDVQNTDWFSPYAVSSEHFNITHDVNFFNPSLALTRKDAAQILYRFIYVVAVGKSFPSEIALNDNFLTEVQNRKNITPSDSIIPADGFQNIILDNDLETTYTKNQIISISGTTSTLSTNSVSVFLHNNTLDSQKVFQAETHGNTFSIPVVFSNVGKFELGILDNNSGIATTYNIVVIDKPFLIKENNTSSISCELQIEQTDDGGSSISLSSKWDNYIFKVEHNGLQKSFLTTDTQNFKFPYSEFHKWPEGEYVLSALSFDENENNVCSSKKSIQAVTHHYSFTDENLNINNLSHYSNINQSIIISGKSASQLRPTYEITTPTGEVQSFPLIENHGFGYLDENTPFSISYQPKKDGVYIIEINHASGIAELNYPLYVGNVYPIIPDFKDMILTYRGNSLTNINLQSARVILVDMINKSRKKQGKQPVTLDEKLITLAQSYADDMAAQNFFSHTSPDGTTVSQRALIVGITTPVGENLSRSIDLYTGHEGLLRSPIHRENLLDDKWNIVGIGVSQQANGSYNIVQEFSYKAWKPTNTQDVESLAYHLINTTRKNIQMETLKSDSSLRNKLVQWSEFMKEEQNVSALINDIHILEYLDTEKNVADGIVLAADNAFQLEANIQHFTDIITQGNIRSVSIGAHVTESGEAFVSIIFFP